MADLVITGEGCYDETSTRGKVTGTVIAAAARAGVRCTLVAGQAARDPTVPMVTLAALAGGPAPALADPPRWLNAAGSHLARMLPPRR
jgi:glycerate kinase